jgi:hypothetical protein
MPCAVLKKIFFKNSTDCNSAVQKFIVHADRVDSGQLLRDLQHDGNEQRRPKLTRSEQFCQGVRGLAASTCVAFRFHFFGVCHHV